MTDQILFNVLRRIIREEDNSKTHTIVCWRVKEMRLATIKNQIMKTLWPVGPPPSLSGNMTLPSQSARQNLLRVIAEKMKSQNTFVPEDVYTEKIQSFYPSCKIYQSINFPTKLYNLGYLFSARKNVLLLLITYHIWYILLWKYSLSNFAHII